MQQLGQDLQTIAGLPAQLQAVQQTQQQMQGTLQQVQGTLQQVQASQQQTQATLQQMLLAVCRHFNSQAGDQSPLFPVPYAPNAVNPPAFPATRLALNQLPAAEVSSGVRVAACLAAYWHATFCLSIPVAWPCQISHVS
jgi:hypothetical protein